MARNELRVDKEINIKYKRIIRYTINSNWLDIGMHTLRQKKLTLKMA